MRQWITLVEQQNLIEDSPRDDEVDDRTYHAFRARGAHRAVTKPLGYAPGYNVEFHPNSGTPYSARKGADTTHYYDPEIADLETDEGEYAYTRAKHKPGFSETILPLGDGVIYRGIAYEEMQHINDTGLVTSSGEYNMTGQEGLTYWTTSIDSAIYYANGFAPSTHKPTFERPCYVIAANMPKETRHVPGVAEHEVGVARAISQEEIIAMWEGRVYYHKPHSMELRQDDRFGNESNRYRGGSSSGGASGVVWKRLF